MPGWWDSRPSESTVPACPAEAELRPCCTASYGRSSPCRLRRYGSCLWVNVCPESHWHAGRTEEQTAVAPRDQNRGGHYVENNCGRVAIGVTACGTGKQSASTPPATTTTI